MDTTPQQSSHPGVYDGDVSDNEEVGPQDTYSVHDVPPREDSLSPGAAPQLFNPPTSNPQLPPSYFSDPRNPDPIDDLTSYLTTTRLTSPHSPHTSDAGLSDQPRLHRRESIFAPPTPEETCLEFAPYLRDPAHLGQVCQYIHGDPRLPHPPAVQLRRRAIVRELIDSTGAAGSGVREFEVLGGFIRRDRTASVAGVAGAGVSGWRGKVRRGGVDEGREVMDGLTREDVGAVRIDSLVPSFLGNGKGREMGGEDVVVEEEGGRKRTLSFMQGSEDGFQGQQSPSKRRSNGEGGAGAGRSDPRGGEKIRQTRAASEGSIQSWKQMMPAWSTAQSTLDDVIE